MSGLPKKKADLKVVILGKSAVGKSCLIRRYMEGIFNDETTPQTVGASFLLKQWGSYNVAIWDTAGEERYSGLSSFYCRGAGAAILAYDMLSSDSFESLWSRFIPLLASADENCLKVIVGTKKDLLDVNNRAISEERSRKFAKEINANLSKMKLQHDAFFETSSRTGDNVDRVFQFIFETCLPLKDSPKISGKRDTVTLGEKRETTSKSKCC